MRKLNIVRHTEVTRAALGRLLPEGAFPYKLRESIGYMLEAFLDPFDGDGTFSRRSPAEGLFLWLAQGGGLDIRSLLRTDGQLYDDYGQLVPKDQLRPITPVEQMAAYGIWLLEVDAETTEPLSEQPGREFSTLVGWTEAELLNHKAECLVLAQEALSYALRLQAGSSLDLEETKTAKEYDFSAIGKKGAEKRYQPLNALIKYTIDLFEHEAEKWKNPAEAAHDLAAEVVAHGRRIGHDLLPHNAPNTIAKWIRRHLREKAATSQKKLPDR